MQRISTLIAMLALTATARAHFIFVVPNADASHSQIIMSETLDAAEGVNVKLIENANFYVRGADGKATVLSAAPLDAQRMTMPTPGNGTRVVYGNADLGVMTHGATPNLLLYYPKTIIGDPFDSKTVVGEAPVELVPVAADNGAALQLKLLINGQPQPNTEITVVHPDGGSEKTMTDDKGLSPVMKVPGRYGAWARHWVDDKGMRDDQSYDQVRHYAMLVFDFGDQPHAAAQANSGALGGHQAAQPVSATPTERIVTPNTQRMFDMPFETSSFGAVECDGWLYVYGGHVAPTHVYNNQAASGEFYRIDLAGGSDWQKLPSGPRLQGMNLAAHDGAIYRVGGMQSVNEEGDKVDNWSTDQVARFDPATMSWTDMPPLPEPRSSHDVVVIGDRLYALGGWNMRGKNDRSIWHDYMDMLDLSQPNPRWVRIPQPFHRRALIAAELDSRIYAIAGFYDHSEASLEVDIYDPEVGAWSKGPMLPGAQRNGFAPAAVVHDRSIYTSVADGSMYRLCEKGAHWEMVARTTPRIVHRAVAFGSRMLVLGGATRGGNLALIEAVTPTTPYGGMQLAGFNDEAANAPLRRLPIRSSATKPKAPPSNSNASNSNKGNDATTAMDATAAIKAGQRLCPIMTNEPVDTFSATVTYRGKTIAICCDACAERWQRNPDNYAAASQKLLPQLKGMDLPARALQQVYCPVYKNRVVSDSDLTVEYRGRKVRLYNETALRMWNKDPEKYADKALLPQLAAAE